jgi:hypothetical protein
MGVMTIKRCGGCTYAKLTPDIAAKDLTKRLCCGAPPTASFLPQPGGRVTVQMARPIVAVSDDACALYEDKNETDNARDREALLVVSGANDANSRVN